MFIIFRVTESDQPGVSCPEPEEYRTIKIKMGSLRQDCQPRLQVNIRFHH